jgi:glycosyltransferase involved in cell wall biosynthesis
VPRLTATVITRNEAANVDAALASVAWADEILVVDAESTDETVAIARRHTQRVETRPWLGYSDQKNYAASRASHDWILSIDADERVTSSLATEIQRLMAREPERRGYRIPRLTWYLGRWIRSTDWYPDYQLRLYDRRAGEWSGRRVHESVRLAIGDPGVLRAHLEHFPYRDIAHHIATIDRYTTLAAEEWAAAGRRASVPALISQPGFAFFRNYILRGGLTDGKAGLVVSVLNSYYVFLKLAKLWELDAIRRPRVEDRGSRIEGPDDPRPSDLDPRPTDLGPR